MKPPVCAVCFVDVRDDAGAFPLPLEEHLVRFADTDVGASGESEPYAAGKTGHPEGTEWFCIAHLEAARRRTNTSLGDALADIERSRE